MSDPEITIVMARSDTGRALFCARPTHPFANVFRQVFMNSGQASLAGKASVAFGRVSCVDVRFRAFCSTRFIEIFDRDQFLVL